jgi:hypothetical protein
MVYVLLDDEIDATDCRVRQGMYRIEWWDVLRERERMS